ncbi:Macrolide export protein MacA [Burkholderiaceae bacterium]|nr:Macrolide export protein MacA [Burkholderiaceae bacterium]
MKRKHLLFLGIALLVVALPVAKLLTADKSTEVQTESATRRTLAPTILASGTLTYESGVNLMSEVVARVDAIHAKEGDRVTRGQLLMRLDAGAVRAEIAQIEASRRQSEFGVRRQQVALDAQRAKLARYRMLREAGMVEALKFDELVTETRVGEVELATSREALKQTQAQLQQARERLAKTEIRSPIDGKVTAVYVKVGETAVPSAVSVAGSSLLALGDTNGLFAEVNIDETEIAKISVGQTARIVPAAFPDRALTGRVEHVAVSPRQPSQQGGGAPGASQARAYPVKVRLQAPPDGVFFPGMSCRAEISTRREGAEPALAVPVQAVRYDREPGAATTQTSVLLLVNGKALRRTVEVGVADDAHIEVKRGLQAGDSVIVGPAKTLRFLKEGEPVRALRRASPPEPERAASGAALAQRSGALP